MKTSEKTLPTLEKIRILRGSLIQLRRRCGKANCHCARGKPHTTPALSYSRKGTTRILTLRSEYLPALRQALERHRQAEVALERKAAEGLRQLERWIKRSR